MRLNHVTVKYIVKWKNVRIEIKRIELETRMFEEQSQGE